MKRGKFPGPGIEGVFSQTGRETWYCGEVYVTILTIDTLPDVEAQLLPVPNVKTLFCVEDLSS